MNDESAYVVFLGERSVAITTTEIEPVVSTVLDLAIEYECERDQSKQRLCGASSNSSSGTCQSMKHAKYLAGVFSQTTNPGNLMAHECPTCGSCWVMPGLSAKYKTRITCWLTSGRRFHRRCKASIGTQFKSQISGGSLIMTSRICVAMVLAIMLTGCESPVTPVTFTYKPAGRTISVKYNPPGITSHGTTVVKCERYTAIVRGSMSVPIGSQAHIATGSNGKKYLRVEGNDKMRAIR